MFNEAELKADASAVEHFEKDVKGYKRKAGKATREELIKDLPVREIPCTLPGEEQYCDQCSTKLKVLGTQVVWEELEYIPAKLRILRYVQTVYECPECKHTEHPFLPRSCHRVYFLLCR